MPQIASRVGLTNLLKKLHYEKNNLIDWENRKCVICNFPLEINAKGIYATAKEMSYLNFLIQKKHRFLRNIFGKSELKESAALESLNSYFDAFTKFVEISILLENSFGFGNLSNFEQIVHEDLAKVCQIDCGEHENLIELLDHVKKVDIKKTHKKIPRLT